MPDLVFVCKNLPSLRTLNIMTFDDKHNPESVMDYMKELAKKKNIEIDQRLVSAVELSKLNMDLRLANLKKDKYSKEELKTFLRSDFENIEDDKVLDKKENSIGFAA